MFCSMYTVAMDRAHVFFAVLLNLISVQVTFCGTGEHLIYLASPSYERSMSARPFIQAQFHPASGTIQQGIMLPQEHLIPQERIPEEYYYQERIMPQESALHEQRLVPPENMQPQERIVPLDSTQNHARLIPQGDILPEHLVPQENRERMLSQGFVKNMLTQDTSPQELHEEMTQERMVPQENIQKIIHTNPSHSHAQSKQEQATNDQETHVTEEDRAVKGGYEYPHQTYPQTPSYGYNSPPPSYNTPAPSAPSYSAPATTYSPPAHSDPTKFLKPDLTELMKPVTGKMAGKLNGLAGLVLSLLSSGKGLELTGIKDLLIDGILKPLFAAKGGLKALISKLSIPIVALILINVEVLITVWWLWEDCPAVKEIEVTKPSYSPPSAPSYTSNYRTASYIE